MKKFIRPVRAVALLGMIALPLKAQTQPQQTVGFLDVGSEKERVLRVLQILGDVPLYPWSIRQLSPREEDGLKPKTAAAMAFLPAESRVRTFGALKVKLLPIDVQAIYNSAFPYGFNDGPIWAGRGLTGSLSVGIAGRVGRLSFQFEPMLFDAQNQAFPLAPNTSSAAPVNPFYPTAIDLPQRFGTGSYRRFDLGQSSVHLDVGPFAAEVSTANLWWGPALESPLVLGDNAAGFPHLFIGLGHPVSIGIGEVSGRLVWGRLGQSAYSPVVGPDSIRFMSGLVAEFVPKGAPGLEIGVSRFFHSPWPSGGFFDGPFSRPVEGILKTSLENASNPTGVDADNQLASAFARWAVPGSGLEIYGEYGREDHNIDLRDLWQEPDHDAGYMIGLQRAWHKSINRTFVLRGEVLNTRLSALEQGRAQAPWYVHETLRQGHTNLGQLLGAPGGFGGGAATVAADMYSPLGRWTVRWDRLDQSESRGSDGFPHPNDADVMHALGVEREIRRGATSYAFGTRAVWDLNRNFVADKFDLNVMARVRTAW